MKGGSGHGVSARRGLRPRTRRSRSRFRGLGAGVVGVVLASAALAACGTSNASTGPVTLTYYLYPDTSGATTQAVAACSAQSHGQYTISYQQLPLGSDGQRQQLARRLAAGDSTMDILGLDVTWEAEFAEAGWILPWTGANKQQAEADTLKPMLQTATWNGKLYAVWSDAHHVSFSTSSNQGTTWSLAATVNLAPASTALFPWVAAYNDTVEVVYYGTTAASKDDSSAVWNVYLAQTSNDGASFAQSKVSNTSNHAGVICTNGTGCASGTRNLLDLFEVAINPLNGRAAIIYTDDTITKTSSGDPLPQIVLAQQNP